MAENQQDSQVGMSLQNEAHLRFVDNARKVVAIAMGICGLALVVCVRRDDFLSGTLRRDSGLWGWGVIVFGTGLCVCLLAALLLIVENLARPASSLPFTLRSLSVRFLVIVVVTAAIGLGMVASYGVPQAIGAVIGLFFLLAAIRQQGGARACLTVVAVLILGMTIWGTQTSYQYSRRHVNEIVAAGDFLLTLHPRGAQKGRGVDPYGPNVPEVVRKLGASSIWVTEDRVDIFVGENRAFQVYSSPNLTDVADPFWDSGPKDRISYQITDRFWMHDR